LLRTFNFKTGIIYRRSFHEAVKLAIWYLGTP